MLTNLQNIGYANQIAKLFCEDVETGKALCIVSVRQRIKNNFTDELFENYFLPLLNNNNFYVIKVVRIESQGYQFIKLVLEGKDIVTGKATGHVGVDGVKLTDYIGKKWDKILPKFNMVFLGLLPGNKIIARKQGAGYGIFFVPDTIAPPGNGVPFNGGGGIKIIPQPPPSPGQLPTQPPLLELDVAKYIVPAAIIGLAFVAYRNL